jgi:hypothetical protein
MARKKIIKNSKPTPKKVKVESVVEPEEKPFDFGGLPNRDLKKNLGCG